MLTEKERLNSKGSGHKLKDALTLEGIKDFDTALA